MNPETFRVLLVEDNPGDARLVRENLAIAETQTFLVEWAPDLAAGLKRLAETAVDVILLDLTLPDSSGLATFEKIHSQAPQIPTILLTGMEDDALAAQAVRSGAQEYLVKSELSGRFLGRMILYAVERMRAEEALRKSEAQLSNAAIIARLGPWEYDVEKDLFTFNDQFFAIFKTTAAAAGGYTMSSAQYAKRYLHPDDQVLVGEETRKAMETDDPNFHRQLEHRVIFADGSTGYISVRIYIVKDAAGKTVKTYGVNQDITERRQREREMEAVAAVSAALRGAATRAEMIPVILDQMLSLMEADGVMMTLPADGTRELMVEQGRGAWASAGGGKIPFSSDTVAEAVSSGRPFLKNDVRKHTRPLKTGMLGESRSIACIPFIAREQTTGLLWIGSRRNLTDHDLQLLTAVADIAASALRRVTLLDQAEERLQKLESLRTIDRAITGSVNLEIILNVVTRQAIDHLQADAAAILLLQPQTSILKFAIGSGFRTKEIENTRLRLGEGRAGKAAMDRVIVGVPDLSSDSGTARSALVASEGFVAHYAAPLISKGKVKGVMEVYRRTPLNVDSDWSGFFETLAEQAAIAVDNAQMFDGLQRSNADLAIAYEATIEGWSRALDLRDKETEGHTERVTDTTLKLARSMGLSETELVHIRRGALLHDIGKMAIPDSILLKPGPLDDREWEIMRRHPVRAFELLSPIAYLRPALDIPYCHHEHWDGTGYPRGLIGELIPLAARLFAVVDVWDALMSDRPYRERWPADKVLEHIRSKAGTHFDPAAVKAFLLIV